MHNIKKYFLSFFVSLFFLPLCAYAVIDSARILEEFKNREQIMIFESDTPFIDEETLDIMENFKRLSLYNSLSQSAGEKRQYLETQSEKISSRVLSLEASLGELDRDINNLLQEVNKINGEIIDTKSEIDTTKQTIQVLQARVEKSSEILSEYLIYLYKKGNYVRSNNDIDNLKTILLSVENIDTLINDLYFKSIIQVSGQKLIKQHRNFIAELYVKKVELEASEKKLKSLRRSGIIEKNLLDKKRESREYILTVTKGQESLYQKYVQDAQSRQQGLKIRELRERINVNNTQKKLLEQFNCEFVDIINNPTYLSSLSSQCQDINKIIYAESRLSNINLRNNPFSWPILPYAGISAYFRDVSYKKSFGTDHDALDIIAPQETDIVAPADGYVIFIEAPESNNYAYFAIKHSDELVSVYGHVSDISVGLYDFVKKGQVIGKSGGEFGTRGAGLLTTGPHLHFAVYENQEYKDPLEYFDISYLPFREIPEKYTYKYFSDFKIRKGYDFSQVADTKNAGNTFKIVGDDEITRQKYLLNTYAVGEFRNWNIWVDSALSGGIDPTFMMCVGLAETSLGKYMKSKNNIGNVGNNDRGDTVSFPNARSAIVAMTSTFNNKFLGNYTKIEELSRYGNKTGSIYASSEFNWHNNITKCMSHVKGEYIPDDYKFRVIKERR